METIGLLGSRCFDKLRRLGYRENEYTKCKTDFCVTSSHRSCSIINGPLIFQIWSESYNSNIILANHKGPAEFCKKYQIFIFTMISESIQNAASFCSSNQLCLTCHTLCANVFAITHFCDKASVFK